MHSKTINHLFVILGLILMVGCQPANGGDSTTSIPTATPFLVETEIDSTATTTTENLSEEDELFQDSFTLWHPFSGREAEMIDDLVAKFNTALGTEMQVVPSSHADDEILIEDILRSIGTEDEPDVIIAPSYLIKSLASDSVVTPIEFEQGENHNNDFGTTFFPVFWNVDMVDGVRYGIPYIQKGHFLFFNSTWSQALGFNFTPSTVADFGMQTCAAYNQNRFDDSFDNDGTGGYFYPGDPIALMAWLSAFGGGVDENNRGQVIFTTEENTEALSYLLNMYVDNCTWWTNKESKPYRYLANRNTLAFSGQSDEIERLQDVMSTNGALDTWELIAYPSAAGKPIVLFESYSFGIMQSAGEQSADILPFIEWMLAPAQHLEMVYLNGAFPLTTEEIQNVDRSWELFPVWQGALPYIPFLEPIPQTNNWYYIEKVLEDLRWQLIQYAVNQADIPAYLAEAEALVNNMVLKTP